MDYRRVLKFCMWSALAFGAYARLHGLGTWPLAVDEYFIARSVDNIIQHGVPAFSCGGYYMRALPLQYLIVPLRFLGLSAELSGRLVVVAFGFAILPAAYLLAKRLSGHTVACISVALLSLSLWEIEYSRYARMYVPFQAVFLAYVLVLNRVVVDRQRSAYPWMWLLSIIGVCTWAGGVFLLVTNFLPNLMERGPQKVRYWVVSAGLLILGYLYSTWNFRSMGSSPAFPPDVAVQAGGSHFVQPPLLALTLSAYPAWLMAGVVLALVCLGAVYGLVRARGTARERISWAACIVLSATNLFGCLLITLLLSLLLEWINIRRYSRRCVLIASVPIGASLCFWVAYAVFTAGPQQLFPGFSPGGELSKLAVVLFKYPNVFDSILFPWLSVVPVLTIALGGLMLLAGLWAIFAKDGRRLSSLRLTLAVSVLMVAMVGVADTTYTKTRYTFFLLPVLYVVGVTLLYTLSVYISRSRAKRGLMLGLSVLALVGFTEDFGWSHMIRVASMEWNFRLPLNPALSEHYFRRWDNRTPAEFINARAKPDDIIIITHEPVSYYLDRTDYVYRSFHESELAAISCDAGQRERWAGSRLLYRLADFSKVIDESPGSVWIVARLPWDQQVQRILKTTYSAKLAYVGNAKKIGVYKVDKHR